MQELGPSNVRRCTARELGPSKVRRRMARELEPSKVRARPKTPPTASSSAPHLSPLALLRTLALGPLWSFPIHRGHSQSSLDTISMHCLRVLLTTLAIKLTKHCIQVRGCYSNIEETGNLIGQNFFRR